MKQSHDISISHLFISAVVVIEELLKKKVAKIYVSDCNQKRVHDVLDMFAGKVGFRTDNITLISSGKSNP